MCIRDRYRAKVTKRCGNGEYEIFFIDYGNTDVVRTDRLRPLDPTLGVGSISAHAVECRLAYLMVGEPSDGADGHDAAMALGAAAWGKAVLARVEERQGATLLVTLFDPAQVVAMVVAVVLVVVVAAAVVVSACLPCCAAQHQRAPRRDRPRARAEEPAEARGARRRGAPREGARGQGGPPGHVALRRH